ncbi:MAG: ribonuclease H-like domain-containing protein [Chloroflexi bacterium]|nr:ribonuclease H-like domain-containing protein [Chloroflexota bacterium]
MPSSLSDRLKSLGVTVGAGDLTPKPAPSGPARRAPIEQVMEGRIQETPLGEAFVVEQHYELGHAHGGRNLALTAPLNLLAEWAGDGRIAECAAPGFTFLDTETTGLAGGGGTLAFMVGVGRFDETGFHLAQYFLRDPAEEPAMLSALESFLTPCQTLVTFNGKSFDVPLMHGRYITNLAPSPLAGLAQLDLLHLARRLWRLRLPSRALGYLEEHILGETRTADDTPGWLIPELYFDYLRSGDARPLKGVFYHNAMDILSLAALMEHIGHLLADPLNGETHTLDLVSIARLHEDLGYLDLAAQIYERGLAQDDLPPETRRDTARRLARLHRRRGELPNAVSLWWQAAADREVYAHVELAKFYEHQHKDPGEALKWTDAALALIRQPGTPRHERIQWEDDLLYRRARLERRLAPRPAEGEKS